MNIMMYEEQCIHANMVFLYLSSYPNISYKMISILLCTKVWSLDRNFILREGSEPRSPSSFFMLSIVELWFKHLSKKSFCKKKVNPVSGVEEDGDSREDDQGALVNL